MTNTVLPCQKPARKSSRFPYPMSPEDLARHYGTDLAVIDALTEITEMFGTWPTAQYIVMPYGKSISVPGIAAALHRVYEAGRAASSDIATLEPVCPERHNHHGPKPPKAE